MNKAANRLSLGPIPRPEAVKLTIMLSAELKARLDAYAEVHGRVHQAPVDAAALIPHMLAVFVARDRGFKAVRRRVAASAASSPAQFDS